MASGRHEIKTATLRPGCAALCSQADRAIRSSSMDVPARILLVDDNEEGCTALGEILSIFGYEVTTAATGRRALTLLDFDRFDAVVFDLSLPDIDGMDILRTIHTQAETPLALVFSGFDRPKVEAEAIGCDAFILKPQLEELLARLKTLLAERAPEPADQPKVTKLV
jgi:DNA-binding response OmpR family regulator